MSNLKEYLRDLREDLRVAHQHQKSNAMHRYEDAVIEALEEEIRDVELQIKEEVAA